MPRQNFGLKTTYIEDSLLMLSSEQLSALAEAIFDFSTIADLSNWLETNCPNWT